MPAPTTLRVAIVEDDRMTRDAIVTLLNGTPDIRCVGAYRSVEEALESDARKAVDVVLLDINLPKQSGMEGIAPLNSHWPDAQILMLTVFPDTDKVVQSICNGAVGYLLKTTPAPELLSAIRDAAGGGAPMSPEIAKKVVDIVRTHGATAAAPVTDLSAQELKLLRFLADGYGYESAGRHMGISVNTVRTYVRSIYGKLQVSTKSEAVSRALRAGLIR